MNCPRCNARVVSKTGAVIDSRAKQDQTIRRRRQCTCGYRFTTYESIEPDPDLVSNEVEDCYCCPT